MEAYLSFIPISVLCIIITGLILVLVINFDEDEKRPIVSRIVIFFAVIVIVTFNSLMNFFNAQALQESTIKRCYYNGVSVKVNQKFDTDSNGNLIENKTDSVFYINKVRE